MAIAKRLKRAAVAVLTVLGLLLWLVALLLFTRVTENSDEFASRQDVILLINSVGIGVLLILIVSNLWQLVRDYRRHVPGSRLRARMVSLLVMVAVTPLVGPRARQRGSEELLASSASLRCAAATDSLVVGSSPGL